MPNTNALNWTIDVANNGGQQAAVITCQAANSHLNGTGVAAVISEFSTYYSAAKVDSIRVLTGGGPNVEIRRNYIRFSVLAADAATEQTNLAAILVTAANLVGGK